MRDLTTKDVLYALEYMHDALLRIPAQTHGGKAKWRMRGTGAPVKESVANDVRASGLVNSAAEPNGSQSITWRVAA